MSMVFVALPSIADEFGITLRSVAWVVIAQSLTISSLMLPMGRVADMVGRRRMHLLGLTLFAVGAVAVAFAPTFGFLIGARIVMSVGNAMGQSVGTAMVVAVFPEHERGKAIGSQTTAVAIGAASGPIVAGLILQILPWQAMFLLLLIPISIAIVAAYVLLDEERVSPLAGRRNVGFDWGGAGLSAVMVIGLVLVINNPLALSWTSPAIVGGGALVVALFVIWVRWELHTTEPMLDLSLFRSRVFSTAVAARLIGFMGSTAVFFLAPVFLISLRSMEAAAAGGVLFLNALGMGTAAQLSGRLSDRFGAKPFSLAGFLLSAAMAFALSSMTAETPLSLMMGALFLTGISMGLWNVPNNSTIMGSVPANRHGVIGAFTNLIRNMGNVTGQALASAVVVGVMAGRGFDIPLSEIAESAAAGDAFVGGWQWTFRIAAVLALGGLLLTLMTPEPSRISTGQLPSAS
ncbi:MAG: MFS transporter, partial [Acidimicrobiales bacterium]